MNKSRELVNLFTGDSGTIETETNGMEISSESFRKIKGSPLFWTFRKELLNSPLKISENANWYLRSKKKIPGFSSCFYFIDTSVLLEKTPLVIRWCMIETSSGLPRKSSEIFGNFRKMLGNVYLTFGSENFRKSSENRENRRHQYAYSLPI